MQETYFLIKMYNWEAIEIAGQLRALIDFAEDLCWVPIICVAPTPKDL